MIPHSDLSKVQYKDIKKNLESFSGRIFNTAKEAKGNIATCKIDYYKSEYHFLVIGSLGKDQLSIETSLPYKTGNFDLDALYNFYSFVKSYNIEYIYLSSSEEFKYMITRLLPPSCIEILIKKDRTSTSSFQFWSDYLVTKLTIRKGIQSGIKIIQLEKLNFDLGRLTPNETPLAILNSQLALSEMGNLARFWEGHNSAINTISSFTNAAFKMYVNPKKISILPLIKSNNDVIKLAMESFTGGFKLTIRPGFKKRVGEIDLVSAYAHILSELRSLNTPKCEWIDHLPEDESKVLYGFAKAKVTIRDNIDISCVPFRKGDTLYYGKGTFVGTFTWRMLQFIKKYLGTYKIIKGRFYYSSTASFGIPPFRVLSKRIIRLRETGSKQESNLYKTIINSIPGKFQSIYEEEDGVYKPSQYFNPIYSSTITSYCTLIIFEALYQCPLLLKNVVSFNTDSIVYDATSKEVEKEVEKFISICELPVQHKGYYENKIIYPFYFKLNSESPTKSSLTYLLRKEPDKTIYHISHPVPRIFQPSRPYGRNWNGSLPFTGGDFITKDYKTEILDINEQYEDLGII
jgi:hypothetical protein